MASLEDEFHKEMLAIYDKALDALGIKLSKFRQMVDRDGGFRTAKTLIHSNSATHATSGFTKLWVNKRLDLTVESLVANNEKWHPLFTKDDIKKANETLEKYKQP